MSFGTDFQVLDMPDFITITIVTIRPSKLATYLVQRLIMSNLLHALVLLLRSTKYNYDTFRIAPHNYWYKRFQSFLPLGSKAPNFSCLDTDGKRVSLSEYHRKSFVVLEFGCMTCAPAVTQAATYPNSLSKLAPKYQPQGVEFLMVYTRETHPGENVCRHNSFSEKMEHAKTFRKEDQVKLRLIVDSLDGKIHRKYGMLPNMVYIISKEGRIVYKASWTDSADIAEALDNLILWDREGFTPMDSVAVVQKYHFIYDRNLEEHKRIYERAGRKAVKDLRREIEYPI